MCSFLGAVVIPLLVGDCDIRNGIGSSRRVVVNNTAKSINYCKEVRSCPKQLCIERLCCVSKQLFLNGLPGLSQDYLIIIYYIYTDLLGHC